MGREEGLVLSLVHSGGRQQAGVDAHGHLVHHAGASQAVAVGGVLQQRSGGAGRGQQVRHGRGRRVRQDGGLGTQVRAPSWQVAGAALGQGEGVAGHRSCEERLLLLLLPPRHQVPVPLLWPRAKVLDLATQKWGRA